MPPTWPHIQSKRDCLNVEDFGARGDGTTNDTAAIQAALDASNTAGNRIVYIPPGTFMFSNLTMYAQTTLTGDSFSYSQLKRIVGSTGIAIREKLPAEGNGASGATNIVVRDIWLNCNGCTGNGLDLGFQAGGTSLNQNASLLNVIVHAAVGTGFHINTNDISSFNLLTAVCTIGFDLGGGYSNWHGLISGASSDTGIRMAGIGDTFHGVQVEQGNGTNPLIRVVGSRTYMQGVRCLLASGNAAMTGGIIRIESAASDPHIVDAALSVNGVTYDHFVYNVGNAKGTGALMDTVPEYFGRAQVQISRDAGINTNQSGGGTRTLSLTNGEMQEITATDTTAFTIAATTINSQATDGYQLTLLIRNNSGGTMGTITWDASFRLAGAFTNPANTKFRTIQFRYFLGIWFEVNRGAADI